jgi:predicted transcriptional regulator
MMTTDLAFCYLDDDVTTARALMDKHGCNHLLVVDRNQVLVGTLERDDLPTANLRETRSLQERSEVVEPREEHAQGVASTIQPGGLDVYDERPTIRAPHA